MSDKELSPSSTPPKPMQVEEVDHHHHKRPPKLRHNLLRTIQFPTTRAVHRSQHRHKHLSKHRDNRGSFPMIPYPLLQILVTHEYPCQHPDHRHPHRHPPGCTLPNPTTTTATTTTKTVQQRRSRINRPNGRHETPRLGGTVPDER